MKKTVKSLCVTLFIASICIINAAVAAENDADAIEIREYNAGAAANLEQRGAAASVDSGAAAGAAADSGAAAGAAADIELDEDIQPGAAAKTSTGSTSRM